MLGEVGEGVSAFLFFPFPRGDSGFIITALLLINSYLVLFFRDNRFFPVYFSIFLLLDFFFYGKGEVGVGENAAI